MASAAMEQVTIAQHGICTLYVQFSKSTRLPAAKRPCGKKTVRSSIAHRTGPARNCPHAPLFGRSHHNREFRSKIGQMRRALFYVQALS